MSKFIGVDYGLERTGLAFGDEETGMVFPLTTLVLKNFPTREALLDTMATKIIETGADALVVGLPLAFDGGETERCAIVRNFVKRMKKRLDLPFYFMSEYLSSAEAWAELRESGAKFQKRKAVLDQAAARKILQSFLNQPPARRIIA